MYYVLAFRKADVVTGGESEDEKVRVDILENQSMDFRNGFVRLCYADFVSSPCKFLIFFPPDHNV